MHTRASQIASVALCFQCQGLHPEPSTCQASTAPRTHTHMPVVFLTLLQKVEPNASPPKQGRWQASGKQNGVTNGVCADPGS